MKKILLFLLAFTLFITPISVSADETEEETSETTTVIHTTDSITTTSRETTTKKEKKKEKTTKKDKKKKKDKEKETTAEKTTEEPSTDAPPDESAWNSSAEYYASIQSEDFIDNLSDQQMIQAEIDASNKAISENQKEIAELEKKIKKSEEERNGLVDGYSQILKWQYVSGAGSAIELLLYSDSVEQYLVRYEMLSRVGKKISESYAALQENEKECAKQVKKKKKEEEKLEKEKEKLQEGLNALKAVNGMSTGTGALLTAEDIQRAIEQGKDFVPTGGQLSYPTSFRNISAGFPNYSSGKYHGGIDYPCPSNTDVHAAADGTVALARNLNYSYGHYIIIDHGNGLSTLYAHNTTLLVKQGDHVIRGQTIALSGSTGNSTGPHCHFEVRVNGTRVDPRNYLNGG